MQPPDDTPDTTAAELALGLLDGEERAAAFRRLLAEPGFAQEVEWWRQHLAPWFELWPAMAAPSGVFARVEHTIDDSGAAITTARSRFWPAATALSSIAAASLLVLVVARPAPVPPPRPVATSPAPLLVAAVAPVGKGTAVTALYDPRLGILRLTPAMLTGAKRSAELWVIAADGVPHPLGLLRATGGSTLPVASVDRPRLAAGATLAVSLEPLGGSPTGLPTGPVVATGALTQV